MRPLSRCASAGLGVLLSVGSAACAPPPPLDFPDDTGTAPPPVEADIDIVYPPDGADIPLGADCALHLVVVVDIEGFLLVDSEEPIEGQGHWHAQLFPSEEYVAVQEAEYVEMTSTAFGPGDLVSVIASLQNAAHQPVGPESISEVRVTDSEAGCP
jgi:hypothetical protein